MKKEQCAADGMSFYKLVWIFFLGSFLGVVIEVIWCLATLYRYESRAGLVIGPFNLVYGFAALFLTVGLYRVRDKRDITVIAIGAAIGTAVEYISSWAQEKLFGTVSWDYTNMMFNLNGRVTLFYSMIWGFLALLWIKAAVPAFMHFMRIIPAGVTKLAAWCMLAFLLFDAALSYAAVTRWRERSSGVAAETRIDTALDAAYPNERMEWIYIHMREK